MKLRLILMLAITGFMMLSACNEEQDKPNNKELIIGSWDFKAFSVTRGNAPTEYYPEENIDQECIRDNLFVFREGGVLEFDEGPTKCSPDDPQVSGTGSYVLSTDQAQIEITEDGGTDIRRIVTLNDSIMFLLQVDSTVDAATQETVIYEYGFEYLRQ